MKQIQARIEVETNLDGLPRRFRYRERAYLVGQVLDAWKYGERWWLHELPRRCYRVQAGHLLAELYAEDVPGGKCGWPSYRIKYGCVALTGWRHGRLRAGAI